MQAPPDVPPRGGVLPFTPRKLKNFVIPGLPAAGSRAEPGIQLLASVHESWIDSRHPWRSRYAPPAAFAFAILQTQSGSIADESGDGPGMTAVKKCVTIELEMEFNPCMSAPKKDLPDALS